MTDITTNQVGDHIKAHADMESEDKASPHRERPMYVQDRHLLYLLALIGDDLLACRRHGCAPQIEALEMQAVVNLLVRT